MVNLLVLTGIVFVGLAFWKGRSQSAEEQKELHELKRVRDDLAEAKKEVGSLLEQLEVVSEKVVEDITSKVEEVRTMQAENSNSVDTAGAAPVAAADSSGGTNHTASRAGSRLQGNETDLAEPDETDDEADEEYFDDAEYEDLDESGDDGEPAGDSENGGPSGFGLNAKKTGRVTAPVEEKFRRSITVLKQNSRRKEPAGSKTFIFPRRQDFNGKDLPVTEKEESAQEVSPKHQMVYAMAKLGYSEEEIAKQLKMGKGEVSLMLELKRKGEEANA